MNKRETILLVDDSFDMVNLLEYTLEPVGYQILKAYNGRTGLEIALTHNPDLIMLDMHMPQMDGLEMLTALRAQNNTIPVIFMTRFGSEETAVKVFRLGIQHYLVKPFELVVARQAVADALRETHLADERERLKCDLVAAKAVQQTVVTLAHHINNQLMVVQSGLSLLTETLSEERKLSCADELQVLIKSSLAGVERITAVLRVLQQITKIKPVEYLKNVQMIDIDAALQEELSKLKEVERL